MSPLPSYRAKRDRVEPEVRLAFQAEGWRVLPLSAPGVPDLLIADARQTNGNGSPVAWALVEVKSPGGKLTTHQKRFAALWGAFPLFVVRSAAEARELSRRLRASGGGVDQAIEDEETATRDVGGKLPEEPA